MVVVHPPTNGALMSLYTERRPTLASPPAAAYPPYVQEVLDEASGRRHRSDPALPGSGGPAGNAQLTAWTGLLLLVLFLAELVTLLSVSSLITWHIALGAALIPPALLKTATTGWRMVRYYTGSRHYQQAGPPPMLLRLLGPLVVLSTLGLLASGVVLALVGVDQTFRPLVTVLGFSVSLLTLHQAAFAVFAGATGLHVLARLVPALRSAHPARTTRHGQTRRAAALLLATSLAAVVAAVVVNAASSWHGFAQLSLGG
jgi:hypothetical protein